MRKQISLLLKFIANAHFMCLLLLVVTLGAVKVYAEEDVLNYRGLRFTPWNVSAASKFVEPREEKPYTIMVYMNGSDLETENGAATNDLLELLESGLDSESANIVLFTGGTYRWQNPVVPDNECAVWEIADGYLNEICGVGLVNMGDSGTLASFINFSLSNFPAKKYGLVLWDHGGGSIAGYGHDERFDDGNLTLLEMEYAFRRAGLAENKLEFLGFDSCLMATVEMAVIAADYANFLIASEDLEPSDGWDYRFLSVLNDNPDMSGADIGIEISNRFMQYYGNASDEILTLSVIDLGHVEEVMDAMGELMDLCQTGLLSNYASSSFKSLASRRGQTKTFGEGSPRDNDCDMVDIGDMAVKLADIYPNESAIILDALDKAVVYNVNNSDVNLYGLSTYYIYGAKESGNEALGTYSGLNMNTSYTQYLHSFYGILRGAAVTRRYGDTNSEIERSELTLWRALQPVDIGADEDAGDTENSLGNSSDSKNRSSKPSKKNRYRMIGIHSGVNIENDDIVMEGASTLWPSIDGRNVCMYKINSSQSHTLYAVPASLNDADCDLIISISDKYPNGKLLGVRYGDGYIIQKGYDKINIGDKLSFYYLERGFGSSADEKWIKDDEYTVLAEPKLSWAAPDGDEHYINLLLTDLRQKKSFTEIIPLEE